MTTVRFYIFHYDHLYQITHLLTSSPPPKSLVLKTRGEANNPFESGPLKIHKILKFVSLSWVKHLYETGTKNAPPLFLSIPTLCTYCKYVNYDIQYHVPFYFTNYLLYSLFHYSVR